MKMPSKTNSRFILAAVASGVLSLCIGLFSNVAAAYIAPAFANQPWLAWTALLVTFAISLPISLFLAFHAPNPSTAMKTPTIHADTLPPAPYLQFFGRLELVDELLAALRDPVAKPIIGIDGLGGIGKTALARQLVERSTQEHLFDVVIWEPRSSGVPYSSAAPLTWDSLVIALGQQLGAPGIKRLANQERQAQLSSLLASTRALIVLDNLETADVGQTELVQQLTPLLRQGGKAILTSRRRFAGDVYSVHLGGLDQESSLQLIRYDARTKGISRVADANRDELAQIASACGGSPLAMKLIVGQLRALPLLDVLASLRNVGTAGADASDDEYIRFYHGIYWNSWRILSLEAQQLLVSLAAFAPEVGGTLDLVSTVSQLDRQLVLVRMDELWRASLVDVEGETLTGTRYALHALTQNFVLSDIARPV